MKGVKPLKISYDSLHEPGSVVVSGTALKRPVVLNPSQWTLANPHFHEAFFSSNNHLGFHKIWRVKGYSLLELLQAGDATVNPQLAITFFASDGLTYQSSLGALTDRYYYPGLTLTNETRVDPVIALYAAAMFDNQVPQGPVQWTPRPLTEEDYDRQRPRLFMGQQKGDPSDDNQPWFLGNLVKIEVNGQE